MAVDCVADIPELQVCGRGRVARNAAGIPQLDGYTDTDTDLQRSAAILALGRRRYRTSNDTFHSDDKERDDLFCLQKKVSDGPSIQSRPGEKRRFHEFRGYAGDVRAYLAVIRYIAGPTT